MFKKVHSSLDPVDGNPSTFFDISLGSSVMKPKRIFVVGEVDNPGAYFMSPSTSIYILHYTILEAPIIKDHFVISN